MTEAVPLGELFHEEALYGLTAQKRWEYPEDVYSRLDFASPSSLGVARPFTNKVEKGWKNVQTLWWAELDRLHSIDTCTPSSGRDICRSKYSLRVK